ncbi:MAG: ycgE 2 [Nocardioidaceae bacterium]|nr:ycgE 2 [Nocardioidaceae bacterium]
MTSEATPTGDVGLLSIGELAERVGLNPATLRMWEQRHGFPVPVRLESGHRRYHSRDVEPVRLVARRRDAGERLDLAISEVLANAAPPPPSIYAALRKRHPHLPVQRLKKSTMTALSWAIEDQFCAQADQAILWGAFQRAAYFEAARPRWSELSRMARGATVFADFEHPDSAGVPVEVSLPDSAPLRREWAVVCDAVDLPVVLTAWELPGQGDIRDSDRIFESMWSVEGAAVATAARVCAAAAGTDVEPLSGPAGVADRAAMTSLMSRMMVYADRITDR